MITEDYVSFETAKLLKEKGFDGEVFLVYRKIKRSPNGKGSWVLNHYSKIYLEEPNCLLCPTLQMAMKWLREVHHCVICITQLTFYCGETVSKWGYCIWADDNTEVDEESSPRLESYEEACEAAIKYCLQNLI